MIKKKSKLLNRINSIPKMHQTEAFTEEWMKPRHIEVDAVQDWKKNFAADVDRVGFAADGDAQHQYRVFNLDAVGGNAVDDGVDARRAVGLTYRESASLPETYPRKFQKGSIIVDPIKGIGQVVDCEFNKSSAMWMSTIQYHTGDSAVSSEDVPLLKKPIGHILLSGLEFLASSRQFVLKAVPVNKIQTTIQKTRMDRLWRLRVGRMWRFVQSKKLE
mmetsp:Transcript_16129/g.19072  ORF Transcript_16129/g.19072 Transcript_16129/m.19072 type:complete len:217 (-) Transcript_16129:102-752(-)